MKDYSIAKKVRDFFSRTETDEDRFVERCRRKGVRYLMNIKLKVNPPARYRENIELKCSARGFPIHYLNRESYPLHVKGDELIPFLYSDEEDKKTREIKEKIIKFRQIDSDVKLEILGLEEYEEIEERLEKKFEDFLLRV